MPDIPLQDYSTQVRDLIRDGRYDEAIAHCQHILRYHPKHVETYSLLGESCLEKGLHREAIDFFQRTLSADPENLTARVGLGVIYDRQDALAEAIWQMERAFELAPGSDKVRDELQRLYARRDGQEKDRLYLTRGALGRLYARNALHERAISEFNGILESDPRLPDIQAALAESLWREGRRLEAVETCLNLLQELPFCLKANLILGEILTRGGHPDGAKEKLGVARALDPENLVALEMMGRDSPLPHEQVYLPLLEMAPDVLDIVITADVEEPEPEQPDETPQPPEGGDAEDLAGVEPEWLQDIRSAVEQEPDAALELTALGDKGPPDEQAPDWLLNMAVAGVAVGAADLAEPGEPEAGVPAEDVPEWLRDEQEQVAQASPELLEPPEDEPSLAPGAPEALTAAAVAGLEDEARMAEPVVPPSLDEGLPPLEETVILPPDAGEPGFDDLPAADARLEPLASERVEAPEAEEGLASPPAPDTKAEPLPEQIVPPPAAIPPQREDTPGPGDDPASGDAGAGMPTGDLPAWARELEEIAAGDHSTPDSAIPTMDGPSVYPVDSLEGREPSAADSPADELPTWVRSLEDEPSPQPDVTDGADGDAGTSAEKATGTPAEEDTGAAEE